MGTKPCDEDHLCLVFHADNQAISVSLDVKDDDVVTKKAGAGIALLDVLGSSRVTAKLFSPQRTLRNAEKGLW